MGRLTPDKRNRLHLWLQQNRGATDRARLEITKDELKDLDADVLLHLAAMAFITMDGLLRVIEEEPERSDNIRAVCKSLGDQLEQKNTAEMRPHANRGRKQLKGASNGGKVKAESSWKARASDLQKAVDKVYKNHPDWSFENIKRQVTKEYEYPGSALKRYTKNPRPK